MEFLLLGLVLFFSAHSVRMIAPNWRERRIAAWGSLPWKGTYALISLIGFVLIIIGYGQARNEPQLLWQPPVWGPQITAVLTIPAFVLAAAAYIPNCQIKVALKDPLLLGTILWAIAHLISNGTVADSVLFGSFLLWSVLCLRDCRKRAGADKGSRSGNLNRDIIAVTLGIAAWAIFGFSLHTLLIGVPSGLPVPG